MSRPDPPLWSISGNTLLVSLHIQPRASKNEVCGLQNNALKIRLTSPPVDGLANKMVRKFMADLLHVPQSAVEIVSGETSRHKRVRISSEDPETLRREMDAIVASL